MLLEQLVYIIGPASDLLDVLGCFLVHPHLMEDSQMDPSVHVSLLHSGCSGFGSFGLATCRFGMVTGSWGLQQNVAAEKMSTNGNVGSFAYHQPQALEQLQ